MIAKIVLRPHKGWIRVWVLVTLTWFAYASTLVVAPWQLVPYVQSTDIVDLQNVKAHKANLKRQAADLCEPGTTEITSKIYDVNRYAKILSGDPRATVRSERELIGDQITDLDEVKRPYNARDVAQRMVNVKKDYTPSTRSAQIIQMSCITFGRRTEVFSKLLLTLFGPPIAVPFLLAAIEAILLSIFRWVRDGFREGTAPSVMVKAPAQDPAAKLAKQDPSAVDLKIIGWSCLLLIVLDFQLRSIVSSGASSGTNILAFFVLAAPIASVMILIKNLDKNWIIIMVGLYWLAGLAFIATNIVRYI